MKDGIIFVDTYINTSQYSSPVIIDVADEAVILDRNSGKIILKKNGVVLDGVPSTLHVDTNR